MLLFYCILFFGATFATVGLAVTFGQSALQRKRAGLSGWAPPQGLFKDEQLSSISGLDAVLNQFDLVDVLQGRLVEADLDWSPGRTTAMMLVTGTAGLAVGLNISFVPVWAALAFGLGSASLPYLYILRRRRVRFEKIDEQLPDALESLAGAMRAGHPLSSALQNLATDQEAPLGPELRKLVDEQRLGIAWDVALGSLCRRLPTQEISLFASAVQLHQRAGGNLGEVLGRLAESMRESQAFQGEVRALAAHGKLTGTVLTFLPLAIGILMSLVNPDFFTPLFVHHYGKHLIGAAICLLVLAHVIIGQIVDIEI